MNKARGVLITGDIYGVVKQPTFTCRHCGNVRKSTGTTRNWCGSCDAEVCQDRVCSSVCHHFQRKLEAAERRAQFYEALQCN